MNVLDNLIYKHLKQNKKLPTLNQYNSVVDNPSICSIEEYKERITQIRQYRRKLKDLIEIPVIEQRTPQWFEARKTMLSASDTYRGIRCNKDIVRKKALGLLGISDETMILNNAIKWGVMFEPVANIIYSSMNNDINIYEFGLIKDTNLECFGASPDGISELGIMLEIKCPYSREIIHGKVKEEYYCQIQGQLAVCGLEECDFAEFKFVQIDRTEYDTMVLENVQDKFYGIIVEDIDQEAEYNKSSCGEDINNNPSPNPNPKYLYSSLREPADEFLPDNYNEIIYWKLEDVHIKRVKFDRKRWDNDFCPKIRHFWDEVLRVKDINEKLPMRYSTHYFIEDTD